MLVRLLVPRVGTLEEKFRRGLDERNQACKIHSSLEQTSGETIFDNLAEGDARQAPRNFPEGT